MLYLEDYLEMIEHLPVELRDRFTEMREMDLSVQNGVDSLQEREKTFFANCKKLKPADRDEEFAKIKREYSKVLEEASEKVQSAEECYGLVDKYLRKLDQELHKFKLELEADNRGITEILEKRSLEMDAPAINSGIVNHKENRIPKKLGSNVKRPNQTIVHGSGGGLPSLGCSTSIDRKSYLFPDLSSSGLDSPGIASLASPSSLTYPLQHMGAGGNAIAAAASQAIAATQQLVPGRRTSSLKASYEAINLGLQTHEFSIGRELAGAAQSALAATAMTPMSSMGGPPSKRQKSNKRSQQMDVLDVVNAGSSLLEDSLLEGVSPSTEDLLGGGSSSRTENSEQEWNYDPSEPRYCVCNQVSYGDMVACDNEDCPYEWFHYPCVGITAPPKGKWYCPTCLARRKARK